MKSRLWHGYWIAYAAAFVACEVTNLSVTHWQAVVSLAFAFLVPELWSAIRNNGHTFSECAWRFMADGYRVHRFPVRLVPVWLLTVAMTLRAASAARLFDGDTDLPYVFGHLPYDLALAGVAVWLGFHFYSLGAYRE